MSEVPLQDPPLPSGGGGNLIGADDFYTENGSSQGPNLALTGLCVPDFSSGVFARQRMAKTEPFSVPFQATTSGDPTGVPRS